MAGHVRARGRLGEAEGGELGRLAEHSQVLRLVCSEPPSRTGTEASPLVPIVVAIAAPPQASSSPISTPSTDEAPLPPYRSGNWEFISPISQALSTISSGQVLSRSYSQATGRISFSAKSCATSRMLRCSSVREKSSISLPSL